MKTHKTKVLKSSLGGALEQRQMDILEQAYVCARDMRAILRPGPYRNTIGKAKAARVPFQARRRSTL